MFMKLFNLVWNHSEKQNSISQIHLWQESDNLGQGTGLTTAAAQRAIASQPTIMAMPP